jgi:cytochrome c553
MNLRPQRRALSGGCHLLAALAVAAFLGSAFAKRSSAATGAEIYQAKCANCHGAHGEGTKKTKRRLEGVRTPAQLIDVIHETMPEDDPGCLSQADTAAVAHYIHEAFYSAVARERNRPARIELARLTVRQYRQTLDDLVNSFRWTPDRNGGSGLKGEYFTGNQFRRESRILERTDPVVQFDFGRESPADKIDAHEFMLKWEGSLLAPETGDYDLIVHTDHAFRLWVNDQKLPIIDAWVKSGTDTEFKASIFLVEGGMYPVRLEFSKSKHGVKDKDKDKAAKKPAANAFITLAWKRPQGVAETIPARCLSPNNSPEAFACATSLPPDDRSYGWERGTTVSKAWDGATTDAALEAVDYVSSKLWEFANTKEDAKDRDAKLKAFCRTFAERAFRRPLSAAQGQFFIDRQFAAAGNSELAVKRSILLILKSAQFLYRETDEQPDPYDIASRLSFGLWDSLPDQELLKAAAANRLANHQQLAQQIERMLKDPRAKTKLHTFLLHWLKVDDARDLAKDQTKYPDFNPAVIADLRTSLELFLDDVVWSEGSDFRRLLTSDEIYLNGRLANFYGLDSPPDAGFSLQRLNGDHRAGVLTHPYLMASFAHSKDTSPILRGVYLARGVLGVSLRPPPEAITPLAPDLHPDLNTRERVTLQTSATACLTCHGIINPLGFTLEHFDAVGRFRELDNGKPIDASGSYRTQTGKQVAFDDAPALARFLIASDEAQAAFVEQLVHHLVQQPIRAYGPRALDDLKQRFVEKGFNIRQLVVEILATTAPMSRDPKVAASDGPPGQETAVKH